jgi:AcrR family transcriptional regulator
MKVTHKRAIGRETSVNSTSRRERKRGETQEKLIAAAMSLISEKGLFDVRVEEITERADVGKGTFFNYFPTKEHLLAFLFAFKREQVAAAAEAMRHAKEVKPLLHQFLLQIVLEPRRTPAMVQSIFSSALMNPTVKEPFCALVNEGRHTIQVALERAQQTGEVRNDFSAFEMASCFQQVLVGTQCLWAMSDPSSNLPDRIERAFEILWSGMAASQRPARSRRRSKP